MIIRTYACSACGEVFDYTCNSHDADPECPGCSIVMEWRPKSFAIKGNISKAADITQKIMEQDYGYTNFKDNTREGETVVMAPPTPTTSSNDALMQQVSEFAQSTRQQLTPQQAHMAKDFWGAGAAAMPQIPVGDALAFAKQQTALATREGVNPMNLLHKAGREGKLPMKINVIARAKM